MRWILILLISLSMLFISCNSQDQSPTPSPAISEAKAVAIASTYLPKEAILQSTITADLGFGTQGPMWVIVFKNISVSREQLQQLGWVDDRIISGSTTIIGSTILGPESPYSNVIIDINANTGEVFQKSAGNGPFLGFPSEAAR